MFVVKSWRGPTQARYNHGFTNIKKCSIGALLDVYFLHGK